MDDLDVVMIHKRPELMKECCQLVNSEWPRSETARMHSLQTSKDNLPTCLVLLDGKKVIGHCKLTPIPSLPEGCFVESVVISKELRGKRLGTFLMSAAEDYSRTLKLKVVYLSTKGQEKFYSKIGYEVCEPVSIYGGPINSSIKRLFPSVRPPPNTIANSTNTPLPPPLQANCNGNKVKETKTYMRKYL